MDSAQFEAAFSTTIPARGPAYLDARTVFLALHPPPIAELEAREGSSDWSVALGARILLGWLNHTNEFETTGEYLRGKLPGKPGITGKFTPMQRANAIAGLGPTITPAVLESIIKVRGLVPEESAAAFAALKLLRDKTAVAPVIALLDDSDPATREGAAGVLGSLADSAAIAPLLAVLSRANEPDTVRASAAASLADLGAVAASPRFASIVTDEALGIDLRKAAVRALARLKDGAATPALVRAAGSATDLTFLILLVETLGSIGDRTALPLLERLLGHEDEFVRDAAAQARAEIGRWP